VLAELGLFDIIFSGHAHYFSQDQAFKQVYGQGNRLGLLSQGFALGGAVCWVRLTVNVEEQSITDHTTGVRLLDHSCEENVAIGAMVTNWKSQYMKALRLDEVLGQCAEHLPLPDPETEPYAVNSTLHLALQEAVQQEFFHQVEHTMQIVAAMRETLVITNRYSAAIPLKAGPVTRYDLMQLIRYNGKMQLVELSSSFLAAIVNRNSLFVGMADFLYIRGVVYGISGSKGIALPNEPLTRDQIKAGALECSQPRVFGEDVDKEKWYWAIIDVYALDTLLVDVPERQTGVRNAVATKLCYRDLVEGFLRRGGKLKSVMRQL